MRRCGRTNEDEGQSDAKGQDVAAQGLVVLAVTFGKHAQAGVDVVFTQSLRGCRGFSKKKKLEAFHSFRGLNKSHVFSAVV